MTDLFKDQTGQMSTMRVLTAFIVVVQTGVWAYCCVIQGDMLPIPPENAVTTLGALGLKGWQRGKEK